MKKSDVQFHSDGFCGSPMRPAINVKVYKLGTTVEMVMERFKCDQKVAEKALEFAFELHQRLFWDEVEDIAKVDVWCDLTVHVYSEGRSSGWLVVDGLEPFESWDAVYLGSWATFVKLVKDNLDYHVNGEGMLETIEAQEWYKPHSEACNFVEGEDGQTRCVADLKAEAIKAGFGAVVR